MSPNKNQKETEEENNNIDFDKIANQLNGFGLFQIRTFGLSCIACFFSGTVAVLSVFIGYREKSRCFVPNCDTESTNYNETFVDFTIPFNDADIDSCTMFASNHQTDCDAQNFDLDYTVNCSQWVYEKDIFQSTAINSFGLVCDKAWLVPLLGSSHMAGLLFGSFIFGILSDIIGRKKSLMVAIMTYTFSGVGSAWVSNYIVYLILRVLTGAGGMAMFSICFVLMVELMGTKWRTFCGIIIVVPFAAGETVTALLAFLIRDWRWLQTACVAPSIFLFSYYWLMPESIQWLVAEDRLDEAEKTIIKVASINKVPAPTHLLQRRTELQTKPSVLNSVMKDQSSDEDHEDHHLLKKRKTTVFDILRYPKTRNRSLILCYGWGTCNIVYYGLSTNSGNLTGNIFVNFTLLMIIEIPSYFFAYFLLERIGRKRTMVSVYIVGGLACIVSGLLPSNLSWTIVILSLVGKFGIAAAFGSIFVYTAELYPTPIRGIGMGICSTCARMGGVLAPIISELGTYYQALPLLIFGCMSFFAGCLFVFLPETCGKDLPQTIAECEKIGEDESLFQFMCCQKKKSKMSIPNYNIEER